MIISYNWIQEYFDKDLPKPKELGSILNTRAFEVEGIEEKDGDYLIDIDILPNRAHDCLSHVGIAREIAVLTELNLKAKEVKTIPSDFVSNIKIQIEDNNCIRYSAQEIQNVIVGDSPQELKDKLEKLGHRSINNIVDITNIVMLELGQPLHAFDRDKLEGEKIIVRNAKKDEKITTLDQQEITLSEENLLITDLKGPLAIAGVKGGNRAEVNKNTKNIIIESANFNSSTVRKSSNKVSIKTESSKRFENAIAPELVLVALNRASELIKKYASDEETRFGEVVDNYPRPANPYKVGISIDEANKILGTNLDKNCIEEILQKLGFQYEYKKVKESVVELIREQLGRPYETGTTRILYDSPNKFDCSSLTAYSYSQNGVSIQRVSIDQYVYSERIEADELEPGDLVFSNQHDGSVHTESTVFLKGTQVPEGIDHVGMYVGDGKIIHATGNKGCVLEEDLSSSEQFKDIIGYGRVASKDEERLVVTVPYERLDIRIKEDLAEEIGRVYGYDKIEDKPIDGIEYNPKINKEYYYNNLIKNILVNNGFSEVMTTTFVDKGDVATLKPISEDRGYLRINLNKLNEVFEFNSKNKDILGLDEINIFEIGKTFNGGNERLILGLRAETVDNIKNAIEEISKNIDIDIKTNNENFVEIDLTDLYQKLPEGSKYAEFPEILNEKYVPFSQYPFIARDIAVWLPEDVNSQKLIDLLKKESGDLLVREPKLFDCFEKEGRVSYAFRLVFQSYEKTLTDEEINEIMIDVNKAIESKGWEVR